MRLHCLFINALIASTLVLAAPTNPGDVDGSGTVDVLDIVAALADKAGTYNTRSDSNNDGQINVFDLVLIARNYGASYGVPSSPTVLFWCDWPTTGATRAAVRDCAAVDWPRYPIVDGNLAVISDPYDFPTQNVYEVTVGDGAQYVSFSPYDGVINYRLQNVGDKIAYRFYRRYTSDHPADDTETHGHVGNSGRPLLSVAPSLAFNDPTGSAYSLFSNPVSKAAEDFSFSTQPQTVDDESRFRIRLNADVTYRIEWLVEVVQVSPPLVRYHVKIYDLSGALLYDDDNLTPYWPFGQGANLQAAYTAGLSWPLRTDGQTNLTGFSSLWLGLNGWSGVSSGNERYLVYGAVAVCDDWCGAYPIAGVEGGIPACTPTTEVCDGQDNDCDGTVDDGVTNACGTCGAVPTEICTGNTDENCDGNVDCDDSSCSTDPACTPSNPQIPNVPIPAGLTLRKFLNFSYLPSGSYGWSANADGIGPYLVPDPAGLPPGFGGVGEMMLTTNSPQGGGAPGSVGLGGLNGRELFIRLLVWWDPNWENHPSCVNKLGYAETAVYNDGVPWIVNYYTCSTTPYLEFRWQGAGSHSRPQGVGAPYNFAPNVGNGSLPKGQWHMIWIHMKSNTGQGDPDVNGTETVNQDGELHAWVAHYDPSTGWTTPVKTHQYTNFAMMDKGFVFNRVKWQPTWGGSGGTIVGTFYNRVADIQVYTS